MNSAIVHGFWNVIFVGRIIHIGASLDSQAMYNFVLKSNSFLVTGGDFGVEASLIAIAGYVVAIGCIMYMYNKMLLRRS